MDVEDYLDGDHSDLNIARGLLPYVEAHLAKVPAEHKQDFKRYFKGYCDACQVLDVDPKSFS